MARLSWNEIRARAAVFAKKWKSSSYEKGEAQSFYNEFFNVFGVDRRRVAVFERKVEKTDNRLGYIDLFWPGKLLVEHKSSGGDLVKAREQAEDYCLGLKGAESPRYILVCDFQKFILYDLEESKTSSFSLAQLPRQVEAFGFIIGRQRRVFRDQDPANITAAEMMGRIHDALEESGYKGRDLEIFLVRLIFCLFADNTGIFDQRGGFLELIEERTSNDGIDLGCWLVQLFQTLNAPVAKRQKTLDEDLASFPYVDGGLFKEQVMVPSFNSEMRNLLLDVCKFDWSKISPAIFGALFQSVMEPAERRASGSHYTTEQNILKVIEPLFMDDLRTEFERLRDDKPRLLRTKLLDFQKKLAGLKFFDPACGCGNFLTIAYRELRLLEIEVLKAMHSEGRRQTILEFEKISLVDVNQFYGIEINEFPTRIAEAALWMMDHMMNDKLGQEFGRIFTRIPLRESPRIHQGDALKLDWAEVLPPKACSFILGNPPFIGSKFQDSLQRSQMREIAKINGSAGTLDFVCAWFLKSGAYVNSSDARIGFVATSSITQGEQVNQLWPHLTCYQGLEIIFAHRPFVWASDARGKASVYVVIIGLAKKKNPPKKTQPAANKRLFSHAASNGEVEESKHKAISPYLFGASSLKNPNLTVGKEFQPINGMSKLVIGSKPIDGGYYIFNAVQRKQFLKETPEAKRFMRLFIGAREFLQGKKRWILALQKAQPQQLAKMPRVRKRIEAVKKYRENSKSGPTRNLAEFPTEFHVTEIPKEKYLVIPKVNSSARKYVPIGWLKPPTIPSDELFVLKNASLLDFALLTSAMHMTWMRTVSGQLGESYRYSAGVVFHTFPVPPRLNDKEKKRKSIESLAQKVLDARCQYPKATLADLYSPDSMPKELLRAHNNLDKAVDRLYGSKKLTSEHERAAFLFSAYEAMCNPLCAKAPAKKKKGSQSQQH